MPSAPVVLSTSPVYSERMPRVAEAAFVVDERRRTTEGEATPLDERTVSAERGGAFVVPR